MDEGEGFGGRVVDVFGVHPVCVVIVGDGHVGVQTAGQDHLDNVIEDSNISNLITFKNTIIQITQINK